MRQLLTGLAVAGLRASCAYADLFVPALSLDRRCLLTVDGATAPVELGDGHVRLLTGKVGPRLHPYTIVPVGKSRRGIARRSGALLLAMALAR